MAIAFMLLVMGVNVADAAECTPDASESEVTGMANGTQTSDNIPAPEERSKLGVCPHGHCHNGSVTAARAVDCDMPAGLTNARFHGEIDQFALSARSSRLKRPPRV
jgi:hypothetical protein